MKTTKSRRISAVLAFAMAVSVLAAGCEKTGEETGSIPSLDEISITTAETTTVPETEPEETTTAAPETEETSETTTSETEETTETTTETSASETSETSENAAEWSETSMSATMYVIENCYSREKAIIGATPISQHYTGDTVEVTAITDTGYYKLAEGGFIHSDYLSDSKPETTTAQTTTAPVQTEDTPDDTAATTSGSFYDPAGGSGSGTVIESTGNYNIKSSSRYAYNQLNADEQTLYNRIVTSVKKLNSVVEVPAGMSKDDIVKVYTIVYDSEPQLFWMGNTVSAGTSFATISFKTTDANEIASMQKEIDAAASKILSKANGYSGTVSKLKVFFDTIVLQSEFSKSEDGYNCSIYNGLTGKGNLQCAGYAKTMQYLCDLAGIESCVVRGTDKDGNSHAWNVVYCENGYYNLDSTWGDPINSFGSDYIQYEFFLVPDAWIHNITHYNVSKLVRGNGNTISLYTPPSCTKEGCNYFAAYNKLYSTKADAEAALYAEFDSAIASGKNVVEVRVSDKSVYDSMMTDDAFRTYQKYAKSKSGSVKQIQRQSSFTKGVYVVHYDVVYQ